MEFTFDLNKYNNTIDKITIAKTRITIKRKCRFVAKDYLYKKFILTNKYDFIELYK
jgi:hypothetical protein